MNTPSNPVTSIDEFISGFPAEVQAILQQVRQTIRSAAPEAEETIKYGIPSFTLQGRNLVHFSAYAQHVGFYPTPSGIEKFKAELEKYQHGKGTLQFPLDEPIPYELIHRVTVFRREETLAKAAAKKAKPAAGQIPGELP
jgi:uncharacterized protein YdhG (YjbR/CyaY superfamily)